MSEQLQELLGQSESELLGSTFFRSMSDSAERTEYDDAVYYEFPTEGLEFVIYTEEAQVVSAIITCESYRRPLPFSLRGEMSSSEVREVLGSPSCSGGGKGEEDALGPVSPWERYEWEQLAMNVTYEADRESIKTVCLMLPNVVPRG